MQLIKCMTMWRGIISILAACLIWSVIFIVPSFMAGFDSLEVALGRYTFFGVASLFALGFSRFQLIHKVDLALAIKAFWLGLAGNILYYFSLVICMRYSSAAISALILGVSPVTIAWYGNWRSRERGFRTLILSTLATLLGLLLVNYPALKQSAFEETLTTHVLGLVAGFLALGLWTWYAISSKVVLSRYVNLTAAEWSTLLGLATLLSAILIALLSSLYIGWDSPHLYHYRYWTQELQMFLIGSAVLGIPCSWIGFYLWSYGSHRLPVTVSGQLLIFETLFGLLLVSIIEKRLPQPIEGVGIVILLIAVFLAMYQLAEKPAVPITEESLRA